MPNPLQIVNGLFFPFLTIFHVQKKKYFFFFFFIRIPTPLFCRSFSTVAVASNMTVEKSGI